MSAGAGAGGHGGLYGDPAADHFAAFVDDHDGFFFQRSPPCAGEGGDGLMTPYSCITDYLQGFLDPAGLAAHLDAPCRASDDAVKQEMEARLMSRHQLDGPAAAGAPATPNSSVLSSSSCEAAGADDEPRHGCKKSRREEEEGQEIDDEGSAAAAE